MNLLRIYYMSDDGPRRTNPLGPYFPSEVPDLPGRGRRWFAVLLAAMFLLGSLYTLAVMIF